MLKTTSNRIDKDFMLLFLLLSIICMRKLFLIFTTPTTKRKSKKTFAKSVGQFLLFFLPPPLPLFISGSFFFSFAFMDRTSSQEEKFLYKVIPKTAFFFLSALSHPFFDFFPLLGLFLLSSFSPSSCRKLSSILIMKSSETIPTWFCKW